MKRQIGTMVRALYLIPSVPKVLIKSIMQTSKNFSIHGLFRPGSTTRPGFLFIEEPKEKYIGFTLYLKNHPALDALRAATTDPTKKKSMRDYRLNPAQLKDISQAAESEVKKMEKAGWEGMGTLEAPSWRRSPAAKDEGEDVLREEERWGVPDLPAEALADLPEPTQRELAAYDDDQHDGEEEDGDDEKDFKDDFDSVFEEIMAERSESGSSEDDVLKESEPSLVSKNKQRRATYTTQIEEGLARRERLRQVASSPLYILQTEHDINPNGKAERLYEINKVGQPGAMMIVGALRVMQDKLARNKLHSFSTALGKAETNFSRISKELPVQGNDRSSAKEEEPAQKPNRFIRRTILATNSNSNYDDDEEEEVERREPQRTSREPKQWKTNRGDSEAFGRRQRDDEEAAETEDRGRPKVTWESDDSPRRNTYNDRRGNREQQFDVDRDGRDARREPRQWENRRDQRREPREWENNQDQRMEPREWENRHDQRQEPRQWENRRDQRREPREWDNRRDQRVESGQWENRRDQRPGPRGWEDRRDQRPEPRQWDNRRGTSDGRRNHEYEDRRSAQRTEQRSERWNNTQYDGRDNEKNTWSKGEYDSRKDRRQRGGW